MFLQPDGSHFQIVNLRPALLFTLPCLSISWYLSGLSCLSLVFLLTCNLSRSFVTPTHVSASGCCCCHVSDVFCISHKGLRGVSSRRLFTSFLWRLSLCWHFVCHREVMINLSVPVSSLFQSLCLPSLSLSVYFVFQTFLSRETMTTVCAKRHATWRATVKRCPLSRSPAKRQPSTLPRNSTRQSST